MVKIDNHQAEYFMFCFMVADLQRALKTNFKSGRMGFETADYLEFFENMPAALLPEYRRKRSYLSSILSKNEHCRDDIYNKQLFFRTRQGFYIPSLLIEVEHENTWVNLYDLLGITELMIDDSSDYYDRLRVLEGYKNLLADNTPRTTVEIDAMKHKMSMDLLKERYNME